VVELSQLRYTVRARTAGDAWGSAVLADGGFRLLLRRREAVLRELRRRGLDFPDEHVEPRRPHEQGRSTSVKPAPHPVPAAPVDLTAKVEQLEQGLLTRTVIGQAEGILIERHNDTADGAFSMPVQASQTSNRKLRDIAAHLVLTGELVGPPLTGRNHAVES
jgi:hypothetical protein